MKKVLAIIFSSFLLIGGIASCESEYVDGYTLTINKKTVFTNRSPVHSTFTSRGKELWLTYNNFSFSNNESDNCFAYLEKGGYLDFRSNYGHRDIKFKFSQQCTGISFVTETEEGTLVVDKSGNAKISTNDIHIYGGHLQISLSEISNVEKIGILEIKISNFNPEENLNRFDGFNFVENDLGGYTIYSYSNYLEHKKIYIPEIFNGKPVSIIKSYAFYYGYNLGLIEEVFFPDSIIEIGEFAFCYLSELTTIHISDNSQLKIIGDYAFAVCKMLTSISLPAGVTSIGEYAFNRCNLFIYVIIPTSVTRIGVYAFSNSTVIFYYGDAEQYALSGLNVDPDKLYFYSETQPTSFGNYWHYSNGIPRVWIF